MSLQLSLVDLVIAVSGAYIVHQLFNRYYPVYCSTCNERRRTQLQIAQLLRAYRLLKDNEQDVELRQSVLVLSQELNVPCELPRLDSDLPPVGPPNYRN